MTGRKVQQTGRDDRAMSAVMRQNAGHTHQVRQERQFAGVVVTGHHSQRQPIGRLHVPQVVLRPVCFESSSRFAPRVP